LELYSCNFGSAIIHFSFLSPSACSAELQKNHIPRFSKPISAAQTVIDMFANRQ